MHIADRKTNKNVQSVMILPTGNTSQLKIGKARGMTSSRPAYASILDNGVISVGIIIPETYAVIQSFYPPGKEKYGGLPYVDDSDSFETIFKRNLSVIHNTEFPEVKILSDLYFLSRHALARTNSQANDSRLK